MRTRALFTLLAVSALAALAVLGLPGAGAAPAQHPPAPAISDWPHQTALLDAAVMAETAGQQRFPTLYAGVSLDLPGDALLVHRIPSPTFDQAIRALIPASVFIRYVDALYSETQLAEWMVEVVADQNYWHGRRIPLNSVGVRIGECVEAGVDEPARDGAAIIAHYPQRPICIELAGAAVPLTAGP